MHEHNNNMIIAELCFQKGRDRNRNWKRLGRMTWAQINPAHAPLTETFFFLEGSTSFTPFWYQAVPFTRRAGHGPSALCANGAELTKALPWRECPFPSLPATLVLKDTILRACTERPRIPAKRAKQLTLCLL